MSDLSPYPQKQKIINIPPDIERKYGFDKLFGTVDRTWGVFFRDLQTRNKATGKTFLKLTDTPSSYSAQALELCRVNNSESSIEFATLGSMVSGTTNEIEVSGTTTLTIGLPDDVTITNDLTVGGNELISNSNYLYFNDTNTSIRYVAPNGAPGGLVLTNSSAVWANSSFFAVGDSSSTDITQGFYGGSATGFFRYESDNDWFNFLDKVVLSSLPAGSADYDTFLVADSGLIKSRTGAQLASDIGAATGGPFTDNAAIRGHGGGSALQDSSLLIDDSGNLTVPDAATLSTTTTSPVMTFAAGGDVAFSQKITTAAAYSTFEGTTAPALNPAGAMYSTVALNNTAGSGVGNYGGMIGFGAADSDNARSAIVSKQGGADGDQMGLAFWVHTSGIGSDPLVEALVLGHDTNAQFFGNLTVPDNSTLSTTTTSPVMTFASAGEITIANDLLQTTGYIEQTEISAPAGDPASNKYWLYVKDDGGTSHLYGEDDAGTVHDLQGSGGIPGGAAGDVQYNDGASGFSGSSDYNYDGTDLTLNDGAFILADTTANNMEISAADGTAAVANLTFYPAQGTNETIGMWFIPKGSGGVAGYKSQMLFFETDYRADSANYSLARIYQTGSAFKINTEKGGSGNLRPIIFSVNGTTGINIDTSSRLNLSGGVPVNTILDEDDMASDTVFGLCTQQSIKAYSDTKLDGSGTNNIVSKFSSSKTLTDSTITDAGTDVSITGDFTIGGGDLVIEGSATKNDVLLSAEDGTTTIANLTVYPNSGTNETVGMWFIPRGTGGVAGFRAQMLFFGTDYRTDSTNYELIRVYATGTSYKFRSEKGGTGTIRPIIFGTTAVDCITVDGSAQFQVNSNQIQDSGGSDAMTFDGSGNTTVTGDLTIGDGAAATQTITGDTSASDISITIDGTNDRWQFDDDIFMPTTERIYFRATGQYIYSSDVNTLNIGATAINAETDEFIIGTGTNNDPYLKFYGDTNTGFFSFDEDNDHFKYFDDILINSTEKLWFHTKDEYEIYSDATDLIIQVADTGEAGDAISLRIAGSELVEVSSSGVELGAPGTNYSKYSTTGDLSFNGTARIEMSKITANNITLTAGTSSDSVTDLQTAHDGNFYNATSASATPGIHLEVEFISVEAFNRVEILAIYDASATKSVGIQLYNFSTTAWDTFDACQTAQENVTTASGYIIENHSFWVASDTNYIGTGGDDGDVRVRFYQTMAGDGTQELYVDVVSLYQ